MKKITCILIDDEPVALRLLEDYAATQEILDVCGRFYDALEAAEFLRGQSVDVIITDIQMPEITGLALAGTMSAKQLFVFTTAYEEYALQSFRFTVVDYLVKPITEKRFNEMVSKLLALRQMPQESPYLFVKSGGQLHRINLDEVCYIRGEKEYVGIHFPDKRLLVYKRMKEMEALLPANFKRTHLSYIVNCDHVEKLATENLMVNGERLPVSRNYRAAIQQALSSF